MKILFLYLLFTTVSLAKPSYTPPKWEGHWEAYSEKDPSKLIGTLDIEKLKGKEYSWKLWVKSDAQRFNAEGECPEIKYNGTAEYNGVNGLNTNLMGIGFVYYQEKGMINLFHDYSSQEITAVDDCLADNFIKK